MSDLERALNDLEATLSHVWDEADREFYARHFPWHTPGPVCSTLADHHHGRTRIFYYPDPIIIDPPDKEAQ